MGHSIETAMIPSHKRLMLNMSKLETIISVLLQPRHPPGHAGKCSWCMELCYFVFP